VQTSYRRFRIGVGYSHHDVDKVTVWDIRQEEWENTMIDAQWECDLPLVIVVRAIHVLKGQKHMNKKERFAEP